MFIYDYSFRHEVTGKFSGYYYLYYLEFQAQAESS